MIDINDLKQKLHEGVVTVEFTKINGERRIMPCTLLETIIPKTLMPKGTNHKKSDDVVSVFSTESQAWRSFRIDSVISYTPSLF